MKTADLTGKLLDEWVARADGYGVEDEEGHSGVVRCIFDPVENLFVAYLDEYSPSTDPAQGQPIMERLRIGVDRPSSGQTPPVWRALGDMPDEVHKRLYKHRAPYTHNNVLSAYGPTMLIAGMRVRVAMAYG